MNTVDKARVWIDEMLDFERKREGVCQQTAMKTLGRRYGIAPGDFWRLKYRPPKGLFVELYVKIANAYARECERQERKFASGRQSAQDEILFIENLSQPLNSQLGEGKRPSVKGAGMDRGQDQPD